MGWSDRLKSHAASVIRPMMIQRHRTSGAVLFSDTTLRDGEQMPGATLEPAEKVEIALALERAGVHSLDAGFPASSEHDREAIRRMVGVVQRPILTALCRTLPGDIDAAAEVLSGQPRHKRGVSLFVGTSPLHREQKLRKSPAEILGLIEQSVRYAAERFDIIAFSPEDASRTELPFLCACYETAIRAGATTIGFPDTVGCLIPEQVTEILTVLQEGVPSINRALLAVHFHNDLGLAVANSLAGLAAGAHVVQCTVNGIGERAGNAALEAVVMALELHAERYGRRHQIQTEQLVPLCRLVAERTGVPLAPQHPIAGRNIFATEAGIHQDGLLKHPETYLPFLPENVGAAEGISLVLGRHSGGSAVAHRLAMLGIEATPALVDAILKSIKDLPKGAVIGDDQLRMWERCEASTSRAA